MPSQSTTRAVGSTVTISIDGSPKQKATIRRTVRRASVTSYLVDTFGLDDHRVGGDLWITDLDIVS